MREQRISSGTTWEDDMGYSRVVRRGAYVAVSGTTAVDGDRVVGEGDAGAQAAFIFRKVTSYLAKVQAVPSDVVRVRLYVTQPADTAPVTAAFTESFGAVRPAASLLIVSGFIDERLLVEIEVDAVVAE